ncbi:MAG TPA: hypothetical protein VE981_05745 [Planctomycetota bacterium]|nr:hypothetical protein [Planctomycetota bacterium]
MATPTPLERWTARVPGYYKVRRPKAVVIRHYGIGRIDAQGVRSFFELTPGRYETSDEAGYAHGNPITVLDYKPPSEGPGLHERVEQLRAAHPRFNLCRNNCEHAVNEIWDGLHESGQVQGWAWALAGVFLVLFAKR